MRKTKAHTLEWYQDKLIIDRDSLDDELEKQPQIFYTVSEAFARALDEREAAKEAHDAAFAKACENAREAFEGKKPTEAYIKQTAMLDEQVQECLEEFNEAKTEAKRWEAMKEAWQQRSFMLGKMCDLYAANYFTSDSRGRKD